LDRFFYCYRLIRPYRTLQIQTEIPKRQSMCATNE
jgi:hypothetical protein